MSEVIQRLAKVIEVRRHGAENSEGIARAVVEALRELPEELKHHVLKAIR